MTEQDQPKKTGPKPKELVEGTILGLPVGRDKTVVPPDQVEELANLGCTDRDIANFFGISESSLRYNFSDNLIKGRELLKIKLRKAMLKSAIVNENVTMQIWLSKQWLGMSDSPYETQGNEVLPWQEEYTEPEENNETTGVAD